MCLQKVSGRNVAFIVLYVEDILIIGDSKPLLESVKAWLCKYFSMKDLGEQQCSLGIKIYRDRASRLIGLSQDTYIDKVLRRLDMINSKKGLLPISTGTILSKSQCPTIDVEKVDMSRVLYALAIDSIMYAMLYTHLDVSYYLSVTSSYQASSDDWTAVKGYPQVLEKN